MIIHRSACNPYICTYTKVCTVYIFAAANFSTDHGISVIVLLIYSALFPLGGVAALLVIKRYLEANEMMSVRVSEMCPLFPCSE